MKKQIFMWLAVIIVMIGGVVGCDKQLDDVSPELKAGKIPATSNCGDYQISMDMEYVGNTTVFIWTVYNPKPGNGSKGTIQDLSNISFEANGCATPGLGLQDLWSDVLEMSYNLNNDAGWITISPTPIIQPNPSIRNCSDANVFKYDVGTYKNTPTMYKLVLLGKWNSAMNTVWFKSGVNTGCCSKEVLGVGCRDVEEFCSMSQGYYFASPHPWPSPGEVEIGGYTYTEAEGRAIWNTSNAGGISNSKKAFTQVAAIKLSGVQDPAVLEKVYIIESWLANIGKLEPGYLPNQTGADISLYGNAAQAAGWIGDWINTNHCVD